MAQERDVLSLVRELGRRSKAAGDTLEADLRAALERGDHVIVFAEQWAELEDYW